MNKKSGNKFLIVSAVIGSIIFGGISFYEIPIWKLFLLKDFRSIDLDLLKGNKKTSMGKITEINGQDFQKKTLDKNDFDKSIVEDLVFNQDTLWTGNNTTAVITLNDGGVLKLEPNTMIQLDLTKYDDETGIAKIPEIKIITGNIIGNSKTQLNLKDEKKGEVKLITSNQRILSKPKIEPKINRKIASIPQEETKVEEIQIPDKIIEIPKELPKIEKEEPKLQKVPEIKQESKIDLIESVNSSFSGTKLNSNKLEEKEIKKFEIELHWKRVELASHYEVHILDNKLKSVAMYRTNENFIKIGNLLFNGKLKYKINAFNQKNKIAESTPYDLKFAYNPPELKSPKNDTVLYNEESKYFFTWEKTNFTEQYIFEISPNENFEKAISNKVGSNFVMIKLISGKYYWRVKSVNSYLESEFSKYKTINIKQD